MNWVDLGTPRPRARLSPYTPLAWPSTGTIPLPSVDQSTLPSVALSDVALRRRTRRTFAELGMAELAMLMTLTCRSSGTRGSDLGFPLSFCPSPSAGAIQPIHVVALAPNLNGWHRYDPHAHVLARVASRLDPVMALTSMYELLWAPKATLLLLAAEPGMTSAKYSDAASLVWRDAGALLGLMALASEALGLAFCPLGVTGEPWASALLDQPGLVGVGAAFVGSTANVGPRSR